MLARTGKLFRKVLLLLSVRFQKLLRLVTSKQMKDLTCFEISCVLQPSTLERSMKSASAKPYGSSAHLAYQLVSGGLGGLREVEIDPPVDVIVLLQSSSVKTS